MRDLTRRNANVMAHHLLREAGLEVFTPMQQIIMTVRGRKQRRDVPVIQDLLFVHESRRCLTAMWPVILIYNIVTQPLLSQGL